MVMASGEGEVSPGGQRAAILAGACVRPTHAGMVPPWNMERRPSVCYKNTTHINIAKKKKKILFINSILNKNNEKNQDFRFVFSFACLKKTVSQDCGGLSLINQSS